MKKVLVMCLLLLQALVVIAGSVVAWQSAIMIDSLDEGLQRHVDQRLLERPMYSIVMDVLNQQQLWLVIVILSSVITLVALLMALKNNR